MMCPALVPRRTAKHSVAMVCHGERSRWSTTLSAQFAWLGRAQDQTHNPSVAGSSPAPPRKAQARGHVRPLLGRRAGDLPRACPAAVTGNRARIVNLDGSEHDLDAQLVAWPAPSSRVGVRPNVRQSEYFRLPRPRGSDPVGEGGVEPPRPCVHRNLKPVSGKHAPATSGRRRSSRAWNRVGETALDRRWPIFARCRVTTASPPPSGETATVLGPTVVSE